MRHCLATTSGTMAQYIAMKAMGIGPGDEVITQAFTFVATVETIVELGATPVVVDVDETTTWTLHYWNRQSLHKLNLLFRYICLEIPVIWIK